MRRVIPSLVVVLLTGCASATAVPTASEAATEPPTLAATDVPPTVITTIEATELPTAEASPRLFGNVHGMVIPHGEAGSWDAASTFPGAIVQADDAFYLFRKGLALNDAGIGSVGLSTSEGDLYHWMQHSEPLFTDMGIEGIGIPGLGAGTVMQNDDGTWQMYLWGGIPAEGHPVAAIWRATAPQPEGPWIADPAEPIFTGGSPGAWDSDAVFFPNVIRTESEYLMWYDGWGTNTEGIGMATSPDGITWTRYDDPATTSDLYAEGDPVFSSRGNQGWDARTMRPSVVQTPSGYVMAYLGFVTSDQQDAIGLAFSEDGIHWERCDCNPVLTREDVPARGNIREHKMVYHNSAFYLFFEFGDNTHTDIWLSVYEGALGE